MWPIKRVIYVMMENRSFDHMFGRFPGANGTMVGAKEGREVPLLRATQWTNHDLPHDQQAALREINGGRMDLFVDTPLQKAFAYTQFHEEDIPNYYAWGKNFVLCDNVFASILGNSYSQHLYMIAGQSGGAWDAPVQSRSILRVRSRQGLAKSWGCDTPEGAYLFVAERPPRLGEAPETFAKKVSPCLTFKTQGDQLTDAGIDWAYYSADDFQVGYIWNAYAAIDHIRNTDQWDKHIRPVDRLIQDIYDENLPAVTWVTPRYELSDHPPWSVCYGHNWVTAVVNGVMRTSMWRSTAIFIVWDEWGGF